MAKDYFTKILQIFIIIIFLIIFDSCRTKEEFPVIPVITIKSFISNPLAGAQGQICLLTIHFTDGDGDIGLNPDDKSTHDLLINCLEKVNGQYEQAYTFDADSGKYIPINFNSKMPLVTTQGKNKNIEGEINYNFSIYNPLSRFDTIAFQIYIIDRALHKSNVVMTNDVIF